MKYKQQSEVDWSQEEEVSKGTGNLCFHHSEPDERRSKYGRNSMDFGQAKDRSIQKNLETSSKQSVLVQLKVAQKKGLQFYQTRSHAIVLHKTLLAMRIEKVVCMKTKEELYHKVYQSPRLPRVVLKANSQSGQQDQQEEDARTSCDHPSASQSSRETWCNNVDYRIPGKHHSAVEQQDTNRRDTVKKLIQQFESDPNKESFVQDLNKSEEIDEFSEKSQKLIADMNNTDIFELCETSSKKQCPECAFCWEIGIVYCTCGRYLKSSQRTEELDKNSYDVLPIPGNVIKKNTIRGAKHGVDRGENY